MEGSPDAKKPCKGILKTSSSFDRHSTASNRKSAKFDEFNVLQTYHPADKDYGHMKIEEPKTPYNYAESDLDSSDQLDAELLAEKLRLAASGRTSSFDDDESSEEENLETDDEKDKRVDFEKRRKAHYKEFEAVKMARKLIEEEEDDDEGDDDSGGGVVDTSKVKGSATVSSSKTTSAAMDVTEDALDTSPSSSDH